MLITKIFGRNSIKNTSTLFIMTLFTLTALILSKIKRNNENCHAERSRSTYIEFYN